MVGRIGFGILMGSLCAGCCCIGPDFGGHNSSGGRNPSISRVRHLVLLKFKEGTPPDQIQEVERRFGALYSKIRQIRDLEWGTDTSPEKRSEGFTHAFLLTFNDAKARDAYLPHPEHQAFVQVLRPCLDKVLVLDYVARK